MSWHRDVQIIPSDGTSQTIEVELERSVAKLNVIMNNTLSHPITITSMTFGEFFGDRLYLFREQTPAGMWCSDDPAQYGQRHMPRVPALRPRCLRWHCERPTTAAPLPCSDGTYPCGACPGCPLRPLDCKVRLAWARTAVLAMNVGRVFYASFFCGSTDCCHTRAPPVASALVCPARASGRWPGGWLRPLAWWM